MALIPVNEVDAVVFEGCEFRRFVFTQPRPKSGGSLAKAADPRASVDHHAKGRAGPESVFPRGEVRGLIFSALSWGCRH